MTALLLLRDEALAAFKARLDDLQRQAAMALAFAERGDIDGVQLALGDVHIQLSAAMHILWHYREQFAAKPESQS